MQCDQCERAFSAISSAGRAGSAQECLFFRRACAGIGRSHVDNLKLSVFVAEWLFESASCHAVQARVLQGGWENRGACHEEKPAQKILLLLYPPVWFGVWQAPPSCHSNPCQPLWSCHAAGSHLKALCRKTVPELTGWCVCKGLAPFGPMSCRPHSAHIPLTFRKAWAGCLQVCVGGTLFDPGLS